MQTAEKDSRFPFVGPDPPATPRNTDTRILTLCASPMCVHTHTGVSRWWRGWVWGQGVCTCLAKQCSLVIWPFRGEWQYANDWPPSATTATGEGCGRGQALSRSYQPPPHLIQCIPPPTQTPSSSLQALFFFSVIMWHPTPHTFSILGRSQAFCFSCCFATSVGRVWLLKAIKDYLTMH